MILLVFGGREYTDQNYAFAVLDDFYKCHPQLKALVQGGARGADRLGKLWALSRGIAPITIDACWDTLGKRRAGPIRNGWMLEFLTIDFYIGFPGGTGTADMLTKCKARNLQGVMLNG